ncbi:Ig-like domain-containing protein [Alloacidobacterium dinghuense]|uniref:Ig-like domain-containing protein n=1 Tax=Alloacidobacterium dinghuense TaxID=2763107 RepID=A0A7G8BIU6_9BACT|nr:Ig-like domain-containing protein [Alloacidobacterium dinghuense]QNI32466.1 Ig-like domain-containing protein [Alloacidobacterium dinghuense]
MFARSCIRGLSHICLGALLGAALIGCTNPTGLDSIQVSPTSQSLTAGQTAQLTATGTYGNANHLSTQNITSGVTWNSSSPSVATISSAGLVTAVGAGTTTITANAQAFNGPVNSSATITVSAAGGGVVSGGSVTSISVIPGAQSVSAPGQTSQFLAIGTTSSGATADLTSQVTWSSSSVQIATVARTGLATAVSQGSTTITAIYNAGAGSVVTGTGVLTVTGGTKEEFTAISVTPSSQSLSSSGQTSQLIALGTSGTGLEQDVTSSSLVRWSSSVPSIATVSASGLVTGTSPGNATITAVLTNPDGTVVSGTASVAINSTPAPEPLLSLQIIPSSITVGNLQDTGNFLAIGTFSTPPYVRDLTNSVTWVSSVPDVFPVNSNNSPTDPGAPGGIVTAYGDGGAVIIAEATSSDGGIQTATATFNCPLVLPNPPLTAGSCFPGSQAAALKATITVYNEGLNTTNWLVTAPSATGTQDVIHCGPGWTQGGGSVCVAPYPIDPTGATSLKIVLEAQGGQFGGWSWSCAPSDKDGNLIPSTSITAAGPNYCAVTLNANNPNVTVGAIFN